MECRDRGREGTTVGDELAITPEKVRATATNLAKLHETLAAAARDIDSKHTDLYQTWTGSAADSMKEIWQRDFGALGTFIDELTGLADKLTTVANELEQTDKNNSNALTGNEQGA